MAQGWLSNKYAARGGDTDNTFKIKRLPKCVENNCGTWDFQEERCGLIQKKNRLIEGSIET